jgi:ElaB/YqjD/DUF883 family membrane-anchored ribosome-binding protein
MKSSGEWRPHAEKEGYTMQNPGNVAKKDNDNLGHKSNMDVGSMGGDMNKDVGSFGTQNKDTGSFGKESRDMMHSGSQDTGASKGFQGTVTSLKEGMSTLTSKASDRVTDYAHRAQEYGGKAVEGTRSYVRENPAQSLLIGFGAGFLIGYAVSRK